MLEPSYIVVSRHMFLYKHQYSTSQNSTEKQQALDTPQHLQTRKLTKQITSIVRVGNQNIPKENEVYP